MNLETTALYGAAIGLLVAGLGFATVIMRARTGVPFGHGDHPGLQRAIRAHGNLIEYAPVFLILLLILESVGVDQLWLHLLGATFLAGRLVSVAYFWMAQIFALRVIALWAAVLPIAGGALALIVAN